MNTTLVGIVTYGNLDFTKLCINSIKETSKHIIDFFVVVGKPDDYETGTWLESKGIAYIHHSENKGFPASINDIYDFAWKLNNYDYLILAGNDVVAYPYAIDSLITLAETSNYECINALQYDVKSLVAEHPQTANLFYGSKMIFKRFGETPWDKFINYNSEPEIIHMQLLDIQNLCLYKKSVFDKVGYTDVAFYPAYFVDNDYARRMVIANIECCVMANARFFHFWSRTINQGEGGSTNKYFENNAEYYRTKWGGDFGVETLSPGLNIIDRTDEEETIEYWREKGR